MQKNEKLERIALVFLTFIIVFSYFIGFYLNENSAGGGEGDFLSFTLKNLKLFNTNSLSEALGVVNTDSSSKLFQSSRIPGFYIFNKFLNPFTENPIYYRLSILLFSILVPIIFYLSLVLKFKNTKKIYLLFLASLVLMSPYFRTSAIWGNEENFAYITLVASYYFLIKYLSTENHKISLLSLVILFSSLCVYFDQKFTLVPAVCFFIIMFDQNKFKLKIYTFFLYAFFSLPVIYLIYIWGGLLPPVDQVGRNVHIGRFNFQHVGYALSIIAFYLFPFVISKIFEERKISFLYTFDKKELIVFIATIFYLIFFLFFYDISSEVLVGKGVFYKITILISDNVFVQKLIMCLVILLSIKFIFITLQKEFINIFVLLFLILTPVLYRPVLQEYYDPMIFLLFFTFLKTKFLINFKSLMILFVYLTIFLTFTNIYYSKII
tara:strand:+ start:1414 stop:2721 length:1308 start_codon:yes stop_codon:yes gene_type:complete